MPSVLGVRTVPNAFALLMTVHTALIYQDVSIKSLSEDDGIPGKGEESK